MKKKIRVLPLLLSALLLCGCSMTEDYRMEGFDTDAILRRIKNEPTPPPTPEPTPTPTPRPAGAEGRVLDLLEALQRDDRETVRSICKTIPGYLTEEPPVSSALLTLYATAYENMSWSFLGTTEGNASASVIVEITVPELRHVFEQLQSRWETDPPTGDRGRAADEALLELLPSATEQLQRRRVTVSLTKEDGEWMVVGSQELYNALTGSLYQTLASFDLPPVKPEDVPLNNERKTMRTCLSDNFLFSFVVTEVIPDAPEGYTVRAEIVNKASYSIVVALKNVLINGYVMDPEWHTEFRPGENRTVDISWDRGELAFRGIDSVRNIVFDLNGFQKAAWPVYPAVAQHGSFCPDGYNTDATPLPTREGEQRLMDHWAAGFTVLDVTDEGCWGCTVTVAVENRCDEDLWFSVGDTFINGAPAEPMWSSTLPGGTRSVERVRFTAGDLIGMDASRADTIDFYLYVHSLDDIDDKDMGVTTHGHYVLQP